ncbi:hypothetical protein QWY15_06900 [Planococcus sp. N064]|uniref:Uncharacterized protein n=1 Tax=Planococcus liqunii TaxID=3058394 RepID=A0ABT8MQ51_9BACL|nr:hypothetical protein [Planococcus sp. N064]MDN7227025.1 hypothetical protein [Planococcus sp. N064]
MEMRRRPCRFDGHKTNRRSGVLCCIAETAYDLENLGAGVWTSKSAGAL